MAANPAPANAGPFASETSPKQTLPLPRYQMLDDAARRVARIALVAAAALIGLQLLQLVPRPRAAAVFDDPVNRLIALVTALTAAGIFALQRYGAVPARTLLQLGMLFEILAAFSIAMAETWRPFDAATPLVGVSAVGPLILCFGAMIPSRPPVRLGLALAAATTWPVAYGINAMRFGFNGSWTPMAVWPVVNYLFAGIAYVAGRSIHGADGERSFLSGRSQIASSGDGRSAQALGSYELLWPIGEGGMGEVWRASHKMLARPAAIKLVKFDAGREEIFERRFHREANAIAGLQSPHTVYLFDFGTTPEGRLYYVMELLDGISLQTLVATFGPQPASRVVAILRQICRSLEEAHDKQIVHRDLKPSNVMICRVAQAYDFVKVLDFGLAKPVGGADALQLTVEGVTLGTPEYMAPEVARSGPVDGRADLYALGCIGYVLLTGTLVFPDANPVAVALKHMRTPPEPPSRRTSLFVPPDLERVILKCLEKEPAGRPAGARELERALAACDVPAWTEEEADAWWRQHLPPGSPLRSFSDTPPRTPPAAQKA